MAKLLFGAGIADARGKLGGHVFSKNRNGAYLRSKVSPSQPRSSKVLVERSNFGALSKAWGMDLTDIQRNGWIALASTNPVPDQFGNPQVLSGIQFYQRVNRNLFQIDVPRLDDPPPDQLVEALTDLTVQAQVTGNILTLTFTPQNLAPKMHLVAFMIPPISPGRSFFTPFLKFVFGDPNDQTGSPKDVFTDYHDVFGQLQEGQKIAANAFIINEDNGASSVPFSATTAILL